MITLVRRKGLDSCYYPFNQALKSYIINLVIDQPFFGLDSGDLYTWGSGSDGQSGHKEEETLAPKVLKFGSKVKWVSCGYYHTAVVTGNVHFQAGLFD